ncbi:DUF4871 domain-containing protein [Paenibacillus hodogayensis]|uniref:DUF4871 domain-containing protein n=1 Tax=Paenibacillus hodogayensis TaxID=279208 RepID=A0ABV5VS44_9BACL
MTNNGERNKPSAAQSSLSGRAGGEGQPSWYDGLRHSPFPDGGMSEKARRQVIGRLYGRRSIPVLGQAAALLTLLVLVSSILVWNREEIGGIINGKRQIENGNERNTRNLYTIGNVKLMEALPGGDYAAGASAGCWWNFYTPFDRLQDRTIRIEGVHRETGYRITELAETKVSEVGKAYDSLSEKGNESGMTRISTRFALPVSGIWSFYVYMDGERYADVVFDVPDPVWKVSPSFRSGAYEMLGIPQRIGLIDAGGFIAGKSNKYMWHVWGNPEELQGEFTVQAVRQGSDRMIPLFSADGLGSALNGADAAIPSMLTLPEPGMWRLMAFIGGRLEGSVVVDVQ